MISVDSGSFPSWTTDCKTLILRYGYASVPRLEINWFHGHFNSPENSTFVLLFLVPILVSILCTEYYNKVMDNISKTRWSSLDHLTIPDGPSVDARCTHILFTIMRASSTKHIQIIVHIQCKMVKEPWSNGSQLASLKEANSTIDWFIITWLTIVLLFTPCLYKVQMRVSSRTGFVMYACMRPWHIILDTRQVFEVQDILLDTVLMYYCY